LAVLVAVLEDRDAGEQPEQERPEEERAALTRPQAGDLVEDLHLAVGIAGHVPVFEPVAHEGGDDADGRHQVEQEHGVDAAFRAEHEIAALGPASREAEEHPPERYRKGNPQREFPEDGHRAMSSGAASYRLPHFVSSVVASNTP